MAGLTEEYLDSLMPAEPQAPRVWHGTAEKDVQRANAIRDEIYKRHGIDPNRSLQEAIDRIEMQAKLRTSVGNPGGKMGAWSNPEEKAAARAEYAKQGKNPTDAKLRFEESIHLLPPESQQYMQQFGRDADFLQSLQKVDAYNRERAHRAAGPDTMYAADGPTKDEIRQEAIRFYDNSANEQVARKGVYGDPFGVIPAGGFQRFNTGWGQAAENAISNPETGVGGYLTWAEIPANAMLTSMRGETSQAQDHQIDSLTTPAHLRFAKSLVRGFLDPEAWGRARGFQAADSNYRPFSHAPVADFPAGAKPTPAQVEARIRELQDLTAKATPPGVDEGWQRTTGYAPPGILTQPGDSAVRSLDPSIVLPMAVGAKALWTAGRAALKPLALDLAKDHLQEQGLNAAIMAGFGGEVGRSNRQFLLGGGTPGVDFQYKTPKELDEARKAGSTLAGMAPDASERVSRANADAHLDVQESGALGPVEQSNASITRRLRDGQWW